MGNTDGELQDQARSHIESLLSELYEPEGVQIWMSNPHRRFENRSALDLIAEGRASEVLGEVHRLTDGAWG